MVEASGAPRLSIFLSHGQAAQRCSHRSVRRCWHALRLRARADAEPDAGHLASTA